MKTAIISDIHSNLEALEAVRSAIEKAKVDQIYCVGDIVGYNANPVECLQIVQEMGALCVAGNHDYGAVGLTDIQRFNVPARIAAEWTRRQLSEKDQHFIKNLPVIKKTSEVTLVHATLNEPEEWGYILSAHEADQSFQVQLTPLCFIGHTHLPVIFDDEDWVQFSPEGSVPLSREKRYIINAGSVGQPRDGNPKASWVLFDSKKWTVDFYRVAYDVEKAQQKVRQAGLPDFLADRLALGK